MKKTYQKPSFSIVNIDTRSVLAGSPNVNGDTDITNANGNDTPPSQASSRPFGAPEFGDDNSDSQSSWY